MYTNDPDLAQDPQTSSRNPESSQTTELSLRAPDSSWQQDFSSDIFNNVTVGPRANLGAPDSDHGTVDSYQEI